MGPEEAKFRCAKFSAIPFAGFLDFAQISIKSPASLLVELIAFFVCHGAKRNELGLWNVEGFFVRTLIANRQPLEVGGVFVVALKCSEHDEGVRKVQVNLLGLGAIQPILALDRTESFDGKTLELIYEFRVRPHSTGAHFFELMIDGKKLASFPIQIS